MNSHPQPRQLKRRTLALEVADNLRDMILTGELAPGSRTTQDELARLLGVSTMPVREALLRLAAEGFFESTPNRSFTVTRTSREDVRDIYWMHSVLAGELTTRACQQADDRLVRTLAELAEQCGDALRANDTNDLGTRNWEFHRTINHAANAPKLLIFLRSSLRFIPRSFYFHMPSWGLASEADHSEIVEAFSRRDPEAARAAAEKHVRDAGEVLIQTFSTNGYWARPRGAEPVEARRRA
jgi:DNA-binding GntR family transcriptional regulator